MTMIRKWASTTAFIAVLVLSASTAQAGETYQSNYTTHGSVAFTTIPRVCAPSPVGCATGGRHRDLNDPDISPIIGGIGGASFKTFEGVPATISISDALDKPISVTIAQSTNGNTTYGEVGEPRVDGCGTSFDLSTSLVPFEADSQVIVFVYTYRESTPCEGAATHGTVTMTTI
jgi:hypothetical protein